MRPKFSEELASPLALKKLEFQLKAQSALKQDMFGPTPPFMFVGSYGYPSVNWGPMVSLEKEEDSQEGTPKKNDDNPKNWWGLPYEKVIENCSMLVRGKKEAGVFSRERKLLEAQEAVMSTSAVDIEVNFTKKPVFQIEVSSQIQPMGASAPLKDMHLADNPKIPKRVDEVVDEGMLANDAITELYSHGFDNYYLTKLLTAGILGRKQNKKLVPTRWSITATDDMLGKQLISEAKLLPEISEIQIYSTEYLFNHFEILLLPGAWEFEQFEAWAPKTLWNMQKLQEMGFDISLPRKKLEPNISQATPDTPSVAHEYEPNWGRTNYAESEAGGYYAGRYGALWGLINKVKRQARVVVFREIHEGYQIPVGVWEVRENTIHSFDEKPACFPDLQGALAHLSTRLRVPIKEYLRKSRIMQQRRLSDF